MTGRRRRREASGQAVIEMALVLPLLIGLVMNFLGVMLVVRLKAEITAATSLGAQAAISAPVGDIKDSCAYASDTFFSTLFNKVGTYSRDCAFLAGSGSFASTNPAPKGLPVDQPTVTLQCAPSGGGPNYFTGAGYYGVAPARTGAPILCTSRVTMDFNKTPLGFAVFWKPVLTVNAQVYPSSVRQKCPNAQCR